MKLPPLLAEYLYTHKRLDLSGIGSFLLDPGIAVDPEQAKSGKQTPIEGISFETNTALKESPDLISFVASSTGKIKALAAADLDSHLELARQFLNIGKPFLFEGIGSLTKMQTGQFSFSPGAILTERVKDAPMKESSQEQDTEDTGGGFKSIFYGRKSKPRTRKILVIILLLAGLVFAIWGGYTVYKKTTARNKEVPADENAGDKTPETGEQAIPQTDTITIQNDNTSQQAATVNPAAREYKFVVETADKTRGLKRYGLLKGFGLDVKMETSDSLSFKIFFLLPALSADTARLIDSLKWLYTPPGNRAFVEK